MLCKADIYVLADQLEACAALAPRSQGLLWHRPACSGGSLGHSPSSCVPLAGINCGVMLFRNTEWAAAFLEDVGQYAYMHHDTIEQYMRPVRI